MEVSKVGVLGPGSSSQLLGGLGFGAGSREIGSPPFGLRDLGFRV